MKKELIDYYKSCNALTALFIKKYFTEGTDWFWVGDEVGGCLSVGDCFLNMNDITDAFVYSATAEQWHEWYWDHCSKTGKREYNLKTFIKLKQS